MQQCKLYGTEGFNIDRATMMSLTLCKLCKLVALALALPRALSLQPTRRQLLELAPAAALLAPRPALADMAPGFAIVDSVNIASNPAASKSRDAMNGNVLFGQDFYFKYGRSAPFLQDASSPLPDNGAMPFTRVQQRYEQYSKYATRVQAGIDAFAAVEGQIKAGDWAKVDATSPAFALRTLGLLANGLMASENTSPANVVFLTRWYVNEVYLDLGDVAKAKDKKDALASWARGKGALNSALIILNKEISPKVGAQFATL